MLICLSFALMSGYFAYDSHGKGQYEAAMFHAFCVGAQLGLMIVNIV